MRVIKYPKALGLWEGPNFLILPWTGALSRRKLARLAETLHVYRAALDDTAMLEDAYLRFKESYGMRRLSAVEIIENGDNVYVISKDFRLRLLADNLKVLR